MGKRRGRCGNNEGIKMRLKDNEIKAIVDCVNELDIDAKIYLFGSRVEDIQKGGDIDLLVISHKLGYVDKVKIMQRLYEKLGEQKIHLLIAKDTADPFAKIAYNKAVLL